MLCIFWTAVRSASNARNNENTPMYVPAHFAETDETKLHDFIEHNSFGLLVSQVDGLPYATHLPFLLERSAGAHGSLVGHLARANPHWRQLNGQTALAVFSGPHAYISPTWYEVQNVVPTWNYVAVHAYGRVSVLEEREALLEIVQRSVAVYESAMPQPWAIDPSSVFLERMLGQIVGFCIEIERLEGKWKMNQNHPVERRERVIRVLREKGGENASAVADLVEKTLVAEE
jgi:transcriptional regulator